MPVALAGRVLVKVSNENGAIAAGDYLTSASSTPGHAMKATRAGRVIGMALESLGATTCSISLTAELAKSDFASGVASSTSSGQATSTADCTGQVMVFVNPHYRVPTKIEITDAVLPGDWEHKLAELAKSDFANRFADLLANFTEKVKASLASLGLLVENGIAKAKEFIADKVTAKKVVAEMLELKDAATGEIYCVKIVNGTLSSSKGDCETATSAPSSSTPSEELAKSDFASSTFASSTSSGQATSTSTSTADTTPTTTSNTSTSTPSSAEPSPSPSPEASPSPSPSPEPSPEITPSPTPEASPEPTPEPSPTPSENPATSPEPSPSPSQ
jgi:hypothetical protein